MGQVMKRFVVFCGLLTLAACARVHIDCPGNSVEHVIIGGNNVGTVAVTALIAMGAHAGVLANPTSRGVTVSPGTTVDYNYVPIFGMDYVECGQEPVPPL